MSVQDEQSKKKAGEEKKRKGKIIGRQSSRCVLGCSPGTGSRQEHHFQFLNSSQQTQSFSGTLSPLSVCSFFPRLVFIGHCSTLSGQPVTVKVALCEILTLPVFPDSNQCLCPTFTPVVSYAFQGGAHQKLTGLAISPLWCHKRRCSSYQISGHTLSCQLAPSSETTWFFRRFYRAAVAANTELINIPVVWTTVESLLHISSNHACKAPPLESRGKYYFWLLNHKTRCLTFKTICHQVFSHRAKITQQTRRMVEYFTPRHQTYTSIIRFHWASEVASSRIKMRFNATGWTLILMKHIKHIN